LTDSSRAVFLSYASQDAEPAQNLCSVLRAAGIEVWLDQSELRGGDAWDQMIRRQIKACYLFVPIISTNTQSREEGYFRREWKIAVDRTHDMAEDRTFLLPIVIDGTSDSQARVPEKFREVQWTRLPGGEATSAFVMRVAALVGSVPAGPSPDSLLSASHVTASAPAGRSARRAVVALAAIATLVVAGWFAWSHRGGEGTFAANSRSIAVMPFADLSERHDQEYFADGLAEEVLDHLTLVPDLHVTARSSSFYFKGRNEKIGSIARELGVANVLEGSVRRVGDTVRVSVQLVRADTGLRLWSSTFNRDVRDIFKVQDEISAAVVEALKVNLIVAKPPLASRRTTNPAAYDQYLLARYAYLQGDRPSGRRAIQAYREAIRLDPGYAPPYAALAILNYIYAAFYDPPTLPAATADAWHLVERAIELAPDLADAYSVRAFIRMRAYFDYEGARADLDRAAALDPSDSAIFRRRSFLMVALGDAEAAISTARRAVELSPLDANSTDALAEALAAAHRPAEAREMWSRTLVLSPNFEEGLHATVGWSYLEEGRLVDARRECSLGAGSFEQTCLAVVLAREGHVPQAREALDSVGHFENRESLAYRVAQGYAAIGDADEALAWLERSYAARDFRLSDVASDLAFEGLRGDPRYKAFLRRMNPSSAAAKLTPQQTVVEFRFGLIPGIGPPPATSGRLLILVSLE
jgi:TolB-like protein